MPEAGIPLTPMRHLMNSEELYTIAKTFVDLGVNKIRLTGGEPLVRKDFKDILHQLSTLPVTLSITTNGVLIDKYIKDLQQANMQNITISLDSLKQEKFKQITRRDEFQKVKENIDLLLAYNFKVKINVVLIKGFNDDEIIDFINLTKNTPINVRFIEFMPFDGNQWNREKLVPHKQVLDIIYATYPLQVNKLTDAPNDTSKNYTITDFKGSFGLISSITNPFCDTCNRIRLTADGKIKNCLFSGDELSLLEPLRDGKNIVPIIKKAIANKKFARAGMDTPEKIDNPELHTANRSMISIGG